MQLTSILKDIMSVIFESSSNVKVLGLLESSTYMIIFIVYVYFVTKFIGPFMNWIRKKFNLSSKTNDRYNSDDDDSHLY